MLTYEKVLEIFEDYLARDRDEEILMTSKGYVRLQWYDKPRLGFDGEPASTPQELFDILLGDFVSFEELGLTKGLRELTQEDIALVQSQCQPYLQKRELAEKS